MNIRPVAADCAALTAGCVFPLSLQPFGYWMIGVVSVALFFVSVQEGSVSRTLARFYLYNLGMFLTGVSWIYVSIHEHGGASPLLAGFLVVLFVLAYSLIALPQGYVYAAFLRSSPLGNIVGFSALWVLQEWTRAWFLTGFPWLFLGYGFLGTYLDGYAPIAGVFGVSLVACLVSACVAAGILDRRVVPIAPLLVPSLSPGE